jgi:hypothetical protein
LSATNRILRSLVFVLGIASFAWAAGERINGNRTLEGTLNYCEDSVGSDSYACNLDPAIIGYITGSRYTFKAGTLNTGVATIAFNGLAVKTIKKWLGTSKADLITGDIQASQEVEVLYDGTDMQLVSQPANTTKTIASGATALGTTALSSAKCTGDGGEPALVTASAPGTLTTDVVLASFNANVSAVTGYTPAVTGTLRIDVYPTSDTVNFKVCNATSASITPGAVTLNWRVVR